MSPHTTVDWGLGFPVVLHNAPTQHLWGEDVLAVNRASLRKEALGLVLAQKTRVSGPQMRFLRQILQASLSVYAEYWGTSLEVVSQWETQGSDLSGEALRASYMPLLQSVAPHIMEAAPLECSLSLM